jgi:hypothetical protein
MSGIDSPYTKALLHFDGADGSTTFTDESGKTWTPAGNAQIDDAQYYFGFKSGLFDGTGDYISAPYSSDWQLDGGSNSNAWTIDFWVRFHVDPATLTYMALVYCVKDANNFWTFRTYADHTLGFAIVAGGSLTVYIANAWTPSKDTWYHVALVKNGATGYLMFIDGTQIGATQTDTDTIPDLTGGTIYVGYYGAGTELNGWMDELRISVGEAKWTGNFTKPNAAYGPATVTPSGDRKSVV